jgi:hypothetical protein
MYCPKDDSTQIIDQTNRRSTQTKIQKVLVPGPQARTIHLQFGSNKKGTDEQLEKNCKSAAMSKNIQNPSKDSNT